MPARLTPAERWARAMTEDDLLRQVGQKLTRFGYHWHHCRPARTKDGYVTPIQGMRGFPDIIAVKQGRPILVIELKRVGGKMRPGQQDWLMRFRQAYHAPVVLVIDPLNVDALDAVLAAELP